MADDEQEMTVDEQKLNDALSGEEDDALPGEEDDALPGEEDDALPGENNLNKVLTFLEDYANEGVLNKGDKGVGSYDIERAITTVNETYGFVDSYPPLSEKLAIIAKDREGYRLLLTGYNPLEIEKEKFDALVNGSYSDRLVSDKDASVYYAYRDGLKVFERDMTAAATLIQKHFRDRRKRNMEDSLWTIS